MNLLFPSFRLVHLPTLFEQEPSDSAVGYVPGTTQVIPSEAHFLDWILFRVPSLACQTPRGTPGVLLA
ncbi:hypothetical protein VTO42DRAFT_1394 [Malbranchea cinnamomea]